MRELLARIGLLFLTFSQLFTGIWAALDPKGWYLHFPGMGTGWVQASSAYDAHFVRDVAYFFIAFGVLFAIAIWAADRRLRIAACVAWFFFAVPHFLYHLTNRGTMSTGQNLLSLEVLALEIAVPIGVIILSALQAATSSDTESADEASG
ncbi:MAG: hypothetical protein M3290_00775 [Actinomycetota bacterium]|nr:hypothetical protein [Actinomycetota bacterium]